MANTTKPTSFGVTHKGQVLSVFLDGLGVNLDSLLSNTTGTQRVDQEINAAIAYAAANGISYLHGNPNSKYLLQDMVSLVGVSNIHLNFNGGTVIDDVRTARPSTRSAHTFYIYDSHDVVVEGVEYKALSTRANNYTFAPTVPFWVGGQEGGKAKTSNITLKNINSVGTSLMGGMFVAVMGETFNCNFEDFYIADGDWYWGINFEYGEIPDQTTGMENGQHPHNCQVRNFNGAHLRRCQGFWRVASCYNITFENSQVFDVTNPIYVYSGDREISRFSQNVTYRGMKVKDDKNNPKDSTVVSIVFTNKDGSTGEELPAWTNYRHTILIEQCEFQGTYSSNSCGIRFFGCQGKVILRQNIIRDCYVGLIAKPGLNPDYVSLHSLLVKDNVFVNNMLDMTFENIRGVHILRNKLDGQNNQLNQSAIGLGVGTDDFVIDGNYIVQNTSNPALSVTPSGGGKNLRLSNNNVRLPSLADTAFSLSNLATGTGNVSNGALVSSGNRILGESATGTRTYSTNETSLDFSVVDTVLVSGIMNNLSSITNGIVGSVIRFRLTTSSASLLLRHVASGVPTTDRIITKSGSDFVATGNAGSVTLLCCDDGWREL